MITGAGPRPSSIVVTGGAGFIGRAFLRLARQRWPDARLVAYDNLSPQAHPASPALAQAELAALGAELVHADICDRNALGDTLNTVAPTVVVHLAAEIGTAQSHDLPDHYVRVNVQGTSRLVECLRAARLPSVTRVILASTRAVYGDGPFVDADGAAAIAQPRDPRALDQGDFAVRALDGRALHARPSGVGAPVNPISIYGSTKLMQEYLLQQGLLGSACAVGIARLQNVYGVGQPATNGYSGVLAQFARNAALGDAIDLFEDGNITRDFICVDDVASALLAMAAADRMPQYPVDIGSGRAVTLATIARLLCDLSPHPAARWHVSGRWRHGDVRSACADISYATQSLGWHPRVSLRAGLSALLAQYGARDAA